MDPLLVAASAADAAGLGVQLAQDLYRLASEHPSVECQIGRIAQAFIDLNLALADLASALPQAHEVVTFSRPCLDYLGALVDRIHGVQKTFRSNLNEDGTSKGSGSQKRNKKSINKLGRLKKLFPGSGAGERFTEMEWMRNTLALLAAVFRLSMSHAQVESSSGNSDQSTRLAKQTSSRIASETLTSAVVIYVRTIEQKLAGPDDDDDDLSDDEEQITGPGSLLFVVPFTPSKDNTKGKAILSKKEAPTMTDKRDAANWIYDTLRDRIKETDRADQLPSQFVDWLLQEVVASSKSETQSAEQPEANAEDANAKEVDDEPTKTADENMNAEPTSKEVEVEVTVTPAPAPISKKAGSKKKGKNKGKANLVAVKPVEPESQPAKTQDENSTDISPEAATAENAETEAATTGTDAQTAGDQADSNGGAADANHKDSDPPTEATVVPDAPSASGQAESPKPSRPAEADRTRDSKFGGRHDSAQEHDDLPPPYPSPEAFMPSRGPPFGNAHYPFPPTNPMPYQAPGAFEDYSSMPYMQGPPAMFHSVRFYPMHPPYMAAQPFYEGRGGSNDAYGYNDHYDSQFPSRPFPSMRRGSIERTRRDGQNNEEVGRSGGLVPRRRPAATVLNSAIFGRFDEEEPLEDDSPRNRRRSPQATRRRESNESRPDSDPKEKEPNDASAGKDGNADGAEASNQSQQKAEGSEEKPREKSGEKSGESASKQDEKEISVEGVAHKGKKMNSSSPKQSMKGSSKTTTTSDKLETTVKNDSESEAETVDIRDAVPVSSNSGKKRNAKNSGGNAKRAGRPNRASSPPPVTSLPTPPTPPSAIGELGHDIDNVEAKGSSAETEETKAEVEEHDGEKEPEAKHKVKDHDADSDIETEKETGDNETKFSPATEPRVFTPPPTPPQAPLPGDAPHPPPAANMPHAPPPVPRGGFPHNGPGMAYYPQPSFPPQHPLLATNPFHPRRGGAPDAADFGMNVGMGMGIGMGMGAGMGAGAMDPLWASLLGDARPPAASRWATAAAAAAATAAAAAAAGMNGPPPPPAGFNSSWIRGDGRAMPSRGPPPPPGPPGPPPRWGRYRSRTVEHEDEEEEASSGHSDDDEPMRRNRHFPHPRRHRSHSPPYHQAPPPPGGRDGTPGGGGGGGGGARGQGNGQRGGHEQQQQQQHFYNTYYDHQQRPSFAKGPSDWGWTGAGTGAGAWSGDVKHPPFLAPQQNSYGWDDNDYGWNNESYRQGRGHAEYEMTEIDG